MKKPLKGQILNFKKWCNQINHPDVKNMLSSNGIIWDFIVEKRSSWGGF